jgi:hypothetical protein
MLAPKVKRYLFNAVLGVLYLGMPIFFVTALYPVLAAARGGTAELAQAQEMLGKWLHNVALPTRTRIAMEQRFKEGMTAETTRVRDYLVHRDAMLERDLLGAYRKDPQLLKFSYKKFKDDLAQKARYAAAKDLMANTPFMPEYDWEKQPAKTPAESDFPIIGKKACIADAIVGMLAPVPCSVGQVAVGQPPAEPAKEEDAPSEPEQGGVLAYRRWPVSVQLLVQARNLGAVLDRLTTPPADYPCMALRAIRLDATERNQFIARLSLEVLDFQ